jgi:hypothetical protein
MEVADSCVTLLSQDAKRHVIFAAETGHNEEFTGAALIHANAHRKENRWCIGEICHYAYEDTSVNSQ